MLVTPGELDHLRHLGFRHLVGVNTANAESAPMYMEHYARRLFPGLVEERLKDVNDELHRCVIVVQHQHLVHRGPLGFGLALDDHTRRRPFALPATVLPVAVAHRHRSPDPGLLPMPNRITKILSARSGGKDAAA